jgi:hypothetical protein
VGTGIPVYRPSPRNHSDGPGWITYQRAVAIGVDMDIRLPETFLHRSVQNLSESVASGSNISVRMAPVSHLT